MLALRSENERLKEQVTALTAEKDSLTEIGADEIEQLGTRIDELTAETQHFPKRRKMRITH